MVVALLGGAIHTYLRSYDEATDEDRAHGVHTRIGNYTRFEPIGMFPISLVLASKKWPNRAVCLADSKENVLRWADFHDSLEVEICLSRVFNSISEDEEVVKSLSANGFEGAESRPPIVGRSNSSITRIIARCIRESDPCGKTIENFWNFPFEIHSYSLTISRVSPGVMDINVTKIAK